MKPTATPIRRARSSGAAVATMATIATMTTMAVVTLAAALLSAPLLAQEPGGPGPQRPGGPGGPGGRGDRTFLYAQVLRGLDEKASLLLEQGKVDAAIEEMRRASGIDIPKESPAYELKTHMVGRFATALAESGRKKEALEAIQKLLADVPPGSVAEASALLDAGMVYKKSGMPDEALKAFDRSIELSQKLARTRGPAGPPMPPPQGRPLRPPLNQPR